MQFETRTLRDAVVVAAIFLSLLPQVAHADDAIAYTRSSSWQVPFTLGPWEPFAPTLARLTPGARPVRLRLDGKAPAWSPVGDRLAYARRPGMGSGRQGIWITGANGKGNRPVTRPRFASDDHPTWAPDSSALAFERSKLNRDLEVRFDLWTVGVDGGRPHRLTRTPRPEFDPSWGPDGRLAFASPGPGGDLDLYLMELDGGRVTRVTGPPFDERNPDWSPDGSLLAFSSETPDRIDIWTMTPAGTDARRLTAAGVDEANEHPTWAPDGSAIAYSAWGPYGNDHELVVTTLDGTTSPPLTGNRTDDLEPDWAGHGG